MTFPDLLPKLSSTSARHSRFRVGLVVAAVAGVVLTGCGGVESSTGGGGSGGGYPSGRWRCMWGPRRVGRVI